MAYGDKRDYPKIDIFVDGDYRATTTWSRTLDEARRKFADATGTPLRQIRAHYKNPRPRRRTRRDEVEDGDYTVQGLYSSGHIVGALGGGGGESYSYDDPEEAIAKAKRLLRSPYFEGDATRVLSRDGELIWSSSPERDRARRRRRVSRVSRRPIRRR